MRWTGNATRWTSIMDMCTYMQGLLHDCLSAWQVIHKHRTNMQHHASKEHHGTCEVDCRITIMDTILVGWQLLVPSKVCAVQCTQVSCVPWVEGESLIVLVNSNEHKDNTKCDQWLLLGPHVQVVLNNIPAPNLFQYLSFNNVILAPSFLHVLHAFDAGNNPNPLFHSMTPLHLAP